MIETADRWNSWLNGYVWGPPMLVLLVGTGILLTVATRGVQFRCFGLALREVFGRRRRRNAVGNLTPFQAVATALASTVGISTPRAKIWSPSRSWARPTPR